MFIAFLLLAVLRSDTGLAQTDTTSTTEPLPYAFVLSERLSPPVSDGTPEAGAPSTGQGSPPVVLGWLEGASDTWRGLPLWSQAAVVSGAIATISLGLIQLFRRLAEVVLEGLGER